MNKTNSIQLCPDKHYWLKDWKEEFFIAKYIGRRQRFPFMDREEDFFIALPCYSSDEYLVIVYLDDNEVVCEVNEPI